MVVVGHLFSFLQKVSGAGVIRTNHTCPCLELSISRKLYPDFFVLEEKYEEFIKKIGKVDLSCHCDVSYFSLYSGTMGNCS